MSKFLYFSLTFLLFTFIVEAQNPVGVFENHTDIGKVLHNGTAIYDKVTQSYQLSGSGENIWFKKDELHFAALANSRSFEMRNWVNLFTCCGVP